MIIFHRYGGYASRSATQKRKQPPFLFFRRPSDGEPLPYPLTLALRPRVIAENRGTCRALPPNAYRRNGGQLRHYFKKCFLYFLLKLLTLSTSESMPLLASISSVLRISPSSSSFFN